MFKFFKSKKRVAEEKKSFLKTLKEGKRRSRRISKYMGIGPNGVGPPG